MEINNYINYDDSKITKINSFLAYIDEIKKSNPGFLANDGFVYRELIRYGLSGEDINEDRTLVDCSVFFDRWVKDYQSDPNINVFVSPTWLSFCQFKKGVIDDNGKDFIKLYIPIKYDHLYEGAKLLFNYIKSLGVDHASKISRFVRSDNVVVRLRATDIEYAKKIIDFVNGNAYLKEGLNSTNPFVPTYKGIGIMRESGISYNGRIADNIADFINSLDGNKDMFMFDNSKHESIPFEKFEATINSFKEYVNKHCVIDEVKENLKLASNKEQGRITTEQKNNIIVDAFKATYVKYHAGQVAVAIKAMIQNNDFSYFSNGSSGYKYRHQLMRLGRDYIKSYIYKYLTSFLEDKDISHDLDTFVDEFVKRFFADDLAFKVDEACSVTLLKNGRKHLENAIKNYINKEDYSMFSRHYNDDTSINYRKVIMGLGKHNFIFGMERSLASKGVDIRYVPYSSLVDVYVNELDKSIYTKFEDTPKVSKM